MDFEGYVEQLRTVYANAGLELTVKPPATKTALAQAAREIQSTLDAGLATAWACADGADRGEPVFLRPKSLTGLEFSSIARALETRGYMETRSKTYGDYRQPSPRDPRIAPEWYAPGWLPFADFGGGSLSLISDHSPERRGAMGQVIAYIHDPDEIVYLAESFSGFLELSMAAIRDDPGEFLWARLDALV